MDLTERDEEFPCFLANSDHGSQEEGFTQSATDEYDPLFGVSAFEESKLSNGELRASEGIKVEGHRQRRPVKRRYLAPRSYGNVAQRFGLLINVIQLIHLGRGEGIWHPSAARGQDAIGRASLETTALANAMPYAAQGLRLSPERLRQYEGTVYISRCRTDLERKAMSDALQGNFQKFLDDPLLLIRILAQPLANANRDDEALKGLKILVKQTMVKHLYLADNEEGKKPALESQEFSGELGTSSTLTSSPQELCEQCGDAAVEVVAGVGKVCSNCGHLVGSSAHGSDDLFSSITFTNDDLVLDDFAPDRVSQMGLSQWRPQSRGNQTFSRELTFKERVKNISRRCGLGSEAVAQEIVSMLGRYFSLSLARKGNLVQLVGACCFIHMRSDGDPVTLSTLAGRIDIAATKLLTMVRRVCITLGISSLGVVSLESLTEAAVKNLHRYFLDETSYAVESEEVRGEFHLSHSCLEIPLLESKSPPSKYKQLLTLDDLESAPATPSPLLSKEDPLSDEDGKTIREGGAKRSILKESESVDCDEEVGDLFDHLLGDLPAEEESTHNLEDFNSLLEFWGLSETPEEDMQKSQEDTTKKSKAPVNASVSQSDSDEGGGKAAKPRPKKVQMAQKLEASKDKVLEMSNLLLEIATRQGESGKTREAMGLFIGPLIAASIYMAGLFYDVHMRYTDLVAALKLKYRAITVARSRIFSAVAKFLVIYGLTDAKVVARIRNWNRLPLKTGQFVLGCVAKNRSILRHALQSEASKAIKVIVDKSSETS